MAASSPAMAPSEAFGVKGALKDGVHFVDATTVIYVAGHCVVLKDPAKRAQRFITGTPSMEGISALAVSNNMLFLAVAEVAPLAKPPQASQGDAGAAPSHRGVSPAPKAPIINVYSVKKLVKRRALVSDKAGSREYVSLSFSCDGKHIAALGGAPEWQLQLWHINSTKVLGAIKTATLTSSACYQVRCCPVNENIMTVVGDGFAKTFKTSDNVLRQVSTEFTNQEGHKVFCHAWLHRAPVDPAEKEKEEKGKEKEKEGGSKAMEPEKEKAKEKKEKEKKKKKEEDNEQEQDCGCVYALDSGELLYVENGEVVATIPMYSNGGEECVAHAVIQYSKGFICGENGTISVYEYEKATKMYKKVRSIKVEETGAQVCGLALSPAEDVLVCIVSTNCLIHLPFQHVDSMSADTVSDEVHTESYHQAVITGMDTCLLKPFVVTCSKDTSVRVWNYAEHLCEIAKFFPSEALSVSMHPNGLYVLVGFPESLQLFNLLIDDMRLWKEFTTVKGCVDCSFSRGGQYFAAVNVNSIHIYSTYTGQNIGNLRAHINRVRSIWWAHDDYNIVTAGLDGAIYEWTLKTFKRSREHVIKGCMYTCVVGVGNSRCFLGIGSDRKLREMDEVEVFKTFDSNVTLTQIALCVGGGVLFAGTEYGAVRAYQYPLTEDGLMMMFDVRVVAGPHGTPRERPVSIPWSHEVLITKADLEEYRSKVQELQTKIEETIKHCEYQMRFNDDQLNGRLRNLQLQYEALLDDARAKHQALVMDKAEMELELDRKQIRTEEIHAQHVRDMEAAYDTKMMLEIARYNQIMHTKEAENARWAQQMETMNTAHERALRDLMEEYEGKLEDTNDEVKRLAKAKEQLNHDFEEVRKQVEEDADLEIEQQKAEYEEMLERANASVRQIMGENGILKSKFLEFQREVDLSQGELHAVVNQKKELYDIIHGCQRDIRTLQHDLEEREETIDEKDMRIHDLKRANQELEKFKYVLDFKVKELVHNIEPTQIEARECKDRMQKMEMELLTAHDKMLHKDMTLTSLKAKLSAAGEEKKRLVQANSRQTELMNCFQLDYYELAQQIEDPRALKKRVMEVFNKYVAGQVKVTKVANPLKQESFHQRDILERKVSALEHTLKRETEKNQRNQRRMIKENMLLINEAKQLRQLLPSKPGTTSAPGPSRRSTPPTSQGITALRTQVAELQLQLSAKCAHIEFLEDQIEPSDSGPSTR